MWQRRKRQMGESFEIVESAKTSFHSRTWQNILNQGENSTSAMVLSSFKRYTCRSPCSFKNEHGDLYLLLHKNIVHIILLNLEKKKKICRKEKKIQLKACAKPLLQHANYDHENKNSTNALRPRCFKLCDLSPNLYDIVLYAPHFLPVKFFPKCYFNKVCFELLQNLT